MYMYMYVRTLYSAVYHHYIHKYLLRHARTDASLVAWYRDRMPDINIEGWEPGWEATLVINGVARQ